MAGLKEGQVIKTKDFKEVKVLRASASKLALGGGGQGVVYKVEYDGKEMALKWYFKNKMKNPQKFYANIENNIKVGRPNESFLWPVDITEWVDDTFGYVMPLRPKEFSDFVKHLLAKEKFASEKAQVNAALNIVDGFRTLHKAGFNYQDLNDGNFFINFQTGDVLICDNDNVMGHGFAAGIAGKARYMAPEIARGDKTPDTMTDRFSLAVVLFLLFFLGHPLEGRLAIQDDPITPADEKRIYGTDPIFIFDPVNTRNAPVPQTNAIAINLWNYYPEHLRKMFIEAFNQDRLHGRIPQLLETDWLYALVYLRSEIVKCKCGVENYPNPSGEFACSCGTKRKIPAKLKFKKVEVPIFPGAVLYAIHTAAGIEDYRNYKTETAKVVTKADNPRAMGLVNLSEATWTLTKPDGTTEPKKKGDVAPIGLGFNINFGNNHAAEIVAN